MPEWTREQKLAIEARDGGVLVAAAAGSGKTTVLVERIITILTDETNPTPADRILAVTFTNAAAASVSARLKKVLYQRILQDPDNEWLRRQRFLLARAQISTVHSFCGALLREHFNELDIPADFTICDALSAESLREQALDAAMGSMYGEENSGIRELAGLFGRARSDRETASLILRLFDFESNLAFPKRWEAECLAAQQRDIPLAQSAIGSFLWQQAENALRSAASLCEQMLAVCDGDEELTAKYAAALQKDLDAVDALLQMAAEKRWDDARRFLLTFSHDSLAAAKKADTAAREQVKEMRESVKTIFKTLKTRVFFCYEADYQAEKAVHESALRVLFDAVDRFSKALFALKQKRRTFEFSDLERLTVQLLCDENGESTPLAAEIGARFDHILVDEYQDTNEMQDLIFSRISKNEQNLFFVGDVKQSIYSFRRADPDIFVARKDACAPCEAGTYPMCVPLRNNFRSSRAVIDGINAVFAPIMRRETGGTDYTADEQLVAYDGSDDRDPLGLCLHIVESEDTADEAQMVAALIAKHLNEGTPVQGENGLRPCRAGDFCILLRATGRANLYAEALAEAGIRPWRDSGDNFFEHSEVAVLLSLLRVMDNPRRDVDLCAVMLSPLFGFTPDDVARLRLEKRQGAFYSAVLASEEEKCRAFVQRLADLRRRSARMGLACTVRFAADETDAEILLCAGPDYEARCRNVRSLIDYAAQFETSAGGGLSAFLAVCERARQSGKSPVSDTFSPPADAVPIISVHRSKGLEWPFVIVANADKQFNLQDASESAALFDGALGVGLRIKRESEGGMVGVQTLAYRALSQHSIARTKSEEMRVLYVALTRAKQRVYVTAKVKDPVKTLAKYSVSQADDYAVSSRNNYLGWLLQAFVANGAGAAFADGACDWQQGALRFALRPPVWAGGVEQQTLTFHPDKALADAIDRSSAFVYGKKGFETVPAKLSVSRLTHNENTMSLLRPRFARAGMSGADKGSATHQFMQIADHAAAAQSVEQELQRLVAGEFMSADVAKGVNIPELKTFFESELSRRILAAKEVRREYAFMDRMDAAEIADVPAGVDYVLVQGIADCVFFEEDGAVLLDYKTDRVDTPQQLAERYAGQVALYRRALNKQLGVPVKQTLLYSFACGDWVAVEE